MEFHRTERMLPLVDMNFYKETLVGMRFRLSLVAHLKTASLGLINKGMKAPHDANRNPRLLTL